MLDHFFPLLFPKNSESPKILDIRFREVGAKRPLSGTSKVNRRTDKQTDRRTNRRTDGQTNGQTDKQTDKSTDRKHRPRGPMLWKHIYIYLLFFLWSFHYFKFCFFLVLSKPTKIACKPKKLQKPYVYIFGVWGLCVFFWCYYIYFILLFSLFCFYSFKY